MKFKVFILSLILFFCGCFPSTNGIFNKKQNTELAINKIKEEQNIAVQKAVNEVIVAKDNYTKSILDNFQKTSDWLYGAQLGVELVPNKDRLWTIIDNRLQVSASYAPAPSKQALEEMNKTLKEELDTTKVSNEELAKKYKVANEKAEEAVRGQAEKEAIIKQKEAEIENVKLDYAKKLTKKQDELNELNDRIIKSEKEKSDNKIYIEKNKRLIMSVCGILALASLAGAIWSPISKREFGIFAATMGAVTIIIPFVQPAHIAMGVGLILLVVVGIIIKKYGIAQKSSENLINFVQTIKDNKPEIYTQVKADLIDANSKYSTDSDGKTIKISDNAVEKHVESVLKDYEKL